MSEDEKEAIYTPRGGESAGKPSYKPDDLVVEAFIKGIETKNLFGNGTSGQAEPPKQQAEQDES